MRGVAIASGPQRAQAQTLYSRYWLSMMSDRGAAWPPIFCSAVPLAVHPAYFHLKNAAPSRRMHGTSAQTEHGR